MIHIFDRTPRNIASFGTYSDLVGYINQKESDRIKMAVAMGAILDGRYPINYNSWMFSYYRHSHLKISYSCMREPPLTETERYAFNHGLDLVEIHQPHEDKPIQIPVTEDVDLEKLKKDFCIAYCRDHGYLILEDDMDGILG